VTAFLTHLARDGNVAASTQIYTHVLNRPGNGCGVRCDINMRGCSPESVRGSLRSELLGHKDVATTRIYTCVSNRMPSSINRRGGARRQATLVGSVGGSSGRGERFRLYAAPPELGRLAEARL
jgi:hypothetical protein